jgi:two-component system CheB/CheR fusion protein
VANEEVQAATEEVETLNEELQATNEELETLNEELQATVEELNTTNDDLQARPLPAPGDARDQSVTRLLEPQAAVGVLGRDPTTDIVNARFRDLFASATFCDSAGRPIRAAEAPIARARRGESFELVTTIRHGRKTIGSFSIRSTAIGDGGAAVVLEARQLD